MTKPELELAENIINPERIYDADFQALFARGRAGVDTPILTIGDSIPFGFGSRAANGGMRMNGLNPQLARALSGQGIKASAQGFFGNGLLHGAGTESADYDSRIAGRTDWRSGVDSLGGRTFFAVTGTDPLPSFTPSEPVDTIVIYWRRAGGGGTFSYAVDGGAATNVSTNGANGLQVTTIPVALGAHTVALTPVSGDIRIYGFDAYDSAKLGLRFINAANCGGILADYIGTANDYAPATVAAALAPKATILGIGANHWNLASPDLAGFVSGLGTIQAQYGGFGPLILMSDPPSNPAGAAPKGSFATQAAFVKAMTDFARANNHLMFNCWQEFGGASVSFGADYLPDGIHPSQQGHGRIVHPMARLFALA